MNILILCKKIPYPPTDGESIVILNDISILKDIGHKVFLYCINTGKHYIETTGYENLPFWEEIKTYKYNPNGMQALFRAFISIFPFQIARFYSKSLDEQLRIYLSKKNIELIVYQGLAMTLFLKNSTIPKFYRIHNVENKIWNFLAINEKNIIKQLFFKDLSISLRKYETEKLNHIKNFICLSDSEKTYFENSYQNSIAIPICLENKFKTSYNSKNIGLVFIGSLDWKPNIEGLNWFLDHVYPHISHISLTIAGKGRFKSKFENIQIISNFEKIEDILSCHRLLIVPLLSGAGIRIKILEALEYGMPVLSTDIGAEGIEHYQNSIQFANDAKTWISKINHLYENIDELNKMSELGKNSFHRFYSKDSIKSKWINILNN